MKAILALAVLLRLFLLTHLFFNPANMFANADSHGYHKLAVSIVQHRTFSKEPLLKNSLPDYVKPVKSINYAPPLSPDAFRTPGYPGFLAIIYALGGNPFIAVVVQSVLSLMIIWLTVLMASRLLGRPAAIMAGLLAALEPLSLIYSHEIMSDTLFVLMVVASTVTFLHWVLERTSHSNIKLPLVSGLLMGLAVLIRPMGTYLPILCTVVAVLYFLFGGPDLSGGKPFAPHRKAPLTALAPLAKRVFFFLLASILTVSIWVMRNHLVFGRPFISTASDHVLLITATSQIVAEMQDPYGISTTQEIRDVLEAELVKQMASEGLDASSPPARVAYFLDWSLNFVKSHPGRFAPYMLKSTPALFVSDITGMYQLLGFTSEATGSWGILFKAGPRAALANYFGPRWPIWVAASTPMILYDLFVYALALLGAIRLLKARRYFLLLFFLLMIGYWTAASSVASMPRYRFPMMPFLICLASVVVSRPCKEPI